MPPSKVDISPSILSFRPVFSNSIFALAGQDGEKVPKTGNILRGNEM